MVDLKNPASLSKNLIKLSIVVYVLSLFFPAVCSQNDCGKLPGWMAAAFGWSTFSSIGRNPFQFISWLANPLMLTTWISFFHTNKNKLLIVVSSLALLCSISFNLVVELSNYNTGTPDSIDQLSIGYWIWLTSIVLAFAAVQIKPKGHKPPPL